MATAHGSTTHISAGLMAHSAPRSPNEVQEYERILKIRDEILSGIHPRLKVPEHVLRKPGTRLGQNESCSGHPPSRPLQSPITLGLLAIHPSLLHMPPPTIRTAAKPASEINPILLTKSDDLVRAELGLQRQRMERSIREQLELQKRELKQKPLAQDTKPDFDVSEVLHKGLEIVKPVSLSDPTEITEQNDSFDDNSYYSSKAPDSPPNVDQPSPSPVSPAAAPAPASAPNAALMEIYNEVEQMKKSSLSEKEIFAAMYRRMMELGMRPEAVDQPESEQSKHTDHVADCGLPEAQKRSNPSQGEDSHHQDVQQQIEAPEEPEYSPPMSLAPPIDIREQRSATNASSKIRHSTRAQDAYEPASPRNVRVVRNHITSPVAPRPSRVSPLAMPQVPVVHPAEQTVFGSERSQPDPESIRPNPSAPAGELMPRKRRRVQERGQDSQTSSYQKQLDESSTAYIKPEPVSPPPFTDDPPVPVHGQHPARPVYIDVESPRYTPVLERPEISGRAPVYEVEPYHEAVAVHGPPRTISRVSSRRPLRSDPDLRRVASLQYARQADYPQYVDADPRDIQPASYAYVERRAPEQPRYYEHVQPVHAPGSHYVAYDDYQRPVYRDPYYEEAPPQAQVASAPQRRFVIDEHGNEYEMIPSRRSQPMAPPPRPISRAPQPKGESYDDRASHRAPSIRASSVIQDPYGDRRYIQEMPPPDPAYRRRVVSDYARPVASERRAYVPMEVPESYSRGGSMQVPEYLHHRPAYVDEYGQPQERMIRTASVRPASVRYEEPREPVQHVGNVHPSGPSRDVGAYMEENTSGNYAELPYKYDAKYPRERPY
ncbi:hypothetical protein N7468_007176 [Penicillium chermesinum]|uniref:Uncharacterized protein n=1 Tax=Penicillium chermesinum TaxID=63820 RepID=A0A9W9TKA9_9EURO|nr:uncharacterized protein N7468_007176 [Penicillium chermesinum]KAJ5225951.1 hypothetical protein N7468_007176 [Penicillium chermesinum]